MTSIPFLKAKPTLGGPPGLGGGKFPDVSHLLAEEVTKPSVPIDVIDFWESPPIQSGVPPALTLPGIFTSAGYQDYISEVALTLLGSDAIARRKEMLLTEDDVTQDDRGLRHLIFAGCFRSALNLTTRLLSVYGQGYNKVGQVSKNTQHSLGLWFTRLSLLLRLGQYDICIKEAEAFGKLDRPDVFFEHYPDLYAGRKGSMPCFSFRLLLAELPIYKGNLLEAMNNLTDLLEISKRIQSKFEGSAEAFWNKRVNRVIHAIVNCSLLMKNYPLASLLLKELIEEKKDLSAKEVSSLKLALSRIFLQCGDLIQAEKYFNQVFEGQKTPNTSEYVNRGLLSIAKAEFDKALNYFLEGLKMDPKNIMLHNNVAVCYLYSGRLKDAIKQYETAIELNPAQALNENLILNVATLYELESNNSRSKKLNLLRKIAQFKPDLNCSVDVCLKIDYKKVEEVKNNENKDTYVV